MAAVILVIGSAIVLLMLPIIEWALIKATSSDRDRMLELAQTMMGSPDYSDEQKVMISSMLDTALDRMFMPRIVMGLPKYIIRVVKGNIAKQPSMLFDEKFSEFSHLHKKSVAAANPLFSMIFKIEVAVLLLVLGFATMTLVIAITFGRVANSESKLLSQNDRLNHA